MKKLKNKVLEKIYRNFMQKKSIEEYKPTKIEKILNYTPVINNIMILRGAGYSKLKALYITFSYTNIINLLCIFVAFCRYYYLKTTPDLYFGIVFFMFFILPTFFLIPKTNNELSQEKINKKLEKLAEEALDKEDFDTVIDNCNKKIVGKVIENNKGELSYKTLFELDELLSKEKESLEQIEIEAIQEVWKKIDKETMLEKFKGKDSKAIIEEFNKIGLNVANGEDLIQEKRFFSKIVNSEKKEEVLI